MSNGAPASYATRIVALIAKVISDSSRQCLDDLDSNSSPMSLASTVNEFHFIILTLLYPSPSFIRVLSFNFFQPAIRTLSSMGTVAWIRSEVTSRNWPPCVSAVSVRYLLPHRVICPTGWGSTWDSWTLINPVRVNYSTDLIHDFSWVCTQWGHQVSFEVLFRSLFS